MIHHDTRLFTDFQRNRLAHARHSLAWWMLAGSCILMCFAMDLLAAPAEQTILATDGHASMPIVVSANASSSTKQVAAELADYLGRMSGAVFEVTTGDGSSGIVLGTIEQFPNESLAEALSIRHTYDGKEAYAIRSQPGRLLLLGATELGASHAAFAFLERMGCRWFFPAKEWEVVPAKPTLIASIDETSRPTVLSRRIWYAWGFFDDAKKQCRNDYLAWSRHNRMAVSLTVRCQHASQAIIAANKATFEAHPEYLALVKGQRRGKQLCVSNPKVQEIAIQYALNYFAQRPAENMVSLGSADGGGFCECASCAEIGSISDQNFFLVNQVAKGIAAQYPDKMVGSYAYSFHSEPPSFTLEPNVYVQLTAGFIYGRYTFDELLNLWPKVCSNIGIYDYYDVWAFNRDMLPASKGSDLSYLRTRLSRYIAAGATSIDAESGNNWGPYGRGYYVANRLMWDPKTDIDALLADFYEQAFGPAASVMKRYYERLDPGNDPIMGEHLLAVALRDLEEATLLAKDRPDVQARLAHLKQYLHYVCLNWDLQQVRKDPARKRDLTLDLFKYAYRIRYSYMIHWEAMRQSWGRQAAKDFNEPTWSPQDRSPKPWETDEPALTLADIEQLFQDDLARFQPQPVMTRAFSSDLVPGGFKHKRAPLPTKHDYQGSGVRYAAYSRHGEPLTFTIITGIVYQDRADATYKLTDPAGRLVQTGRLPQDRAEHMLSLEVPKAGLYWFEFTDNRGGWKMRAERDVICSLALEQNPTWVHMGDVSQLFFYVPKGTKRIDYFSRYGWGSVSDPHGQVMHRVTRDGVNVTVDVPEGSDGQVWSLNNVHLPNIWFFNIPNYVASSPEALLVPKEIAESDGLSVE